MIKIRYYESVDDGLLKIAVIVSRFKGKWVFCKHRERMTYECPAGHREPGESILEAAKRELYEETGAVEFQISPISAYSVLSYDEVLDRMEENFGMLYFAEIKRLEDLLDGFEIERIELLDKLPDKWTYPEVQPIFLKRVAGLLNLNI